MVLNSTQSHKTESQMTLTPSNTIVDRSMDMEIQQVPWWNRRTRMERRFCALSSVLLCVVAALAVGLAGVLYSVNNGNLESKVIENDVIDSFQTTATFTAQEPSVVHLDPEAKKITNRKKEEEEKKNVLSSTNIDDYCLSSSCVQTAAEILSNMDERVDPCQDFYQFACGGFMEKTVIPDDRTRMSSFSVLGDELLTQVRTLLEAESPPNEPKPFKMAKDVYRSCMDEDHIEKMGITPILDILRELGGWPVLEGDKWSTDPDKYLWYQQIYKFRVMGFSVDYFIDFSVTTDVKNSSWRILDLDQPTLGLDREYLIRGLGDEDVKAYLEYMVDVATFLGADKNFAKKEMRQVLEFEMQLANFSLPRESRRNATKLYNPMTIRDLSKLDPNTPWLNYINNILTKDIIQVEDTEIIIVDVPSYVKKFSDLIQKTSARTQANYLLWRVASSSMKYLTDDAKKISLKFSKKLTGKSEETPRWRTCVGAAKGSLTNAVGSMYIKKYFKEDSKEAAMEMVSDIRKEFDRILREIDWMDKATKQKAKEKANAIVELIGYPSELLQVKKLEELYNGLEVDSKHYLRNFLNMTVFGTNYAFSRLREKVNKTDWVRHGRPAVVNAFYSPLENSIQFPAGILQGIFFSNDRPRYMNYGAIGWVIGHEITHGFDDQGRQFDLDGNLVDWWHPETKESYLKKAQCIIDQYGNYTIEELNLSLNGINTQGENIADNGGIKEAYRAYGNWINRNGEEKFLPGLNYSQKQLFWISAANVWCAKYRPKALKLRVLTGVHSPDMFRVRGPFSNMPEFSKDFRCPIGSPMNPVNKCQVW